MEKIPKKSAPAKVKAQTKTRIATKVFLAGKKVSKRSAPKEPVKTMTPAKVKTKSDHKVTKKVPVKKVAGKAAQNPDEVKLIPGTISQRLAEKRMLYERVYYDYVPKVMRPLAIFGGYAYITAGIFLALLMSSPALSNLVSQTATTLCSTGDCQKAVTTEVVDSGVTKPGEFKPLPAIVPGVDTNLQLTLEQGISVRALLLPISGGESLTITGVAESASNIVNFLLPTATLTNGSYLVQAEFYDEDTKQVRVKLLGPTFVVQNVILEPILSNKEPGEDIEATDELLVEEDNGEVLGIATSTGETKNILPGVIDEVVVAASEVKAPEVIKIAPVKKSDTFDLIVVPGTTPNQSVLKILPTYVFEKVELSLKLKGEGEGFFLGNATKAEDTWFYWLDNTSIPNGVYSIIVRGFDNDVLKEEATFVFSNKTTPALSDQAVLDEIETRVNSLLGERVNISELTKQRASYASTYLATSTENTYLVDYLADYLPKLDRAFARYASTVAGGNKDIIILADDQLQKYLDTIVLGSEENSLISINFSQNLRVFTNDIKAFLKTNEEKFVQLSNGDSASDIDFDGFTDYDEVVIYGTDPKLPDTDNDGILDSVEIILSYSPFSDKLEAVSRFSDVDQSGLINGELLALTAVEPYYLYTDISPDPKILTSVTGKGIPNSFARLYIGDLAESIIVKVDSTGTFIQTIDLDFAKVEGEVSLAMTDNTGKVVILGQPLLLRKITTNKELFIQNAIDASVFKSVEDIKTSNTIGAVGVVSFGLILLLLGKALVPRKDPVSLEIA